MNWQKDNLTECIAFENLINSCGCNIIALHGVQVDTMYKKDMAAWAKELRAQLIKLLEIDGDYAQLCLIQLNNSGRYKEAVTELEKVFDIVFRQEVRGGHGNSPLTLYGIDLATLRQQKGMIENWKELPAHLVAPVVDLPKVRVKRKYVKSGKYAKKLIKDQHKYIMRPL